MDLLLLHGAIGASDQLIPLADALSAHYNVHRLDFTGHGNSEKNDFLFSIQLFTDDVIRYLSDRKLENASVFGYSMGGYVAMNLALQQPHLVSKIATLATKYQWDENIAAREVKMVDPEKIVAKLPVFAETLNRRHVHNDWKEVLRKTGEMMLALGADSPLKPESYSHITQPALVMLGDRDTMVTLEETTAVYKSLPNARMAMLPGMPHPIEQADVQLLRYLIHSFLEK